MGVKKLFIVWYDFSRRAETLAAEVDAQVSFQYEVGLKGKWLTPLRYLVQGWKTWRLLDREQPEVVLVQSPPILAPLLVALWCNLRGNRVPYVIDCHPATFYSPWRFASPLLHLLSRRALVTLLCNEAAQDILQGWRVKGIFLPDGLPTFSHTSGTIGSEGEARIAVISVFDSVEPIAEVFAAARLLPEVTFYVTGDPKRATTRLLAQRPENVILTGFLRGETYAGLLESVHGMAILTKAPNDLSCGAYEALGIAKPAIISDWPASRRCFKRGFVYVYNTPAAIAAGIKKLLNEQAMLADEITAMRTEYASTRQPRLEEFAALLKCAGQTDLSRV